MKRNSLTEYPTNEPGDLIAWQGDIVRPGQETTFRKASLMVPNEPFEGDLRLLGFERGRSSAVFVWVTEDGRRFQMFMTDMIDTIALFGVRKARKRGEQVVNRRGWGESVLGYCKGTWRVVKRGQNYGLQPVEMVPSVVEGQV